MKMNINLMLMAFTSIVLLSFKPAIITQKIDLQKSSLGWTAYKVTGKHNGTIGLKSGELQFDGAKLIGGTFEIDMTSIKNLDLSGEYQDKIVNHLKSPDFFNVSAFPQAKFKITKVAHQGKDLYKIIGDLTIKGITKQIRFDTTIKEENGVKTADASIKIDRSEFEIKYGSGSFFDNLGDKTVYDEFDLQVQLFTIK